MLSAKFDII